MASSELASAQLSPVEFNNVINRLVPQPDHQIDPKVPLDESIFDKIRDLLDLVGKPEWSQRPRTYAVLLMIDRLDVLDAFVEGGLFDIEFPYHKNRLPIPLDQKSRDQFVSIQSLVLTKSTELEIGKHRHFTSHAVAESCFIVKKVLGNGRTGMVDHVTSKLSLKEYARKRIRRRALPRGQNATQSIENEMRLLKRLSHHHLVKFVGSYTDPEFVGLLITPVADFDLKTFLERKPLQDAFILRKAFGCLAAAVQYLHSENTRHKDIKPANILLKNGEVFITDFGTSRDWAAEERGTTIGITGPYTPAYAAPEVTEWEPRNEAADIWSLGCVFLDMITVLKGEDLETRASFFRSIGTGNLNPRTNREAYISWLAKLQHATLTHNEPIKWIQQMLKEGPRQRIIASELLNTIRAYHDPDEDLTYYGHCCGPDESDLSSICRSSTTLRSGGSCLSSLTECRTATNERLPSQYDTFASSTKCKSSVTADSTSPSLVSPSNPTRESKPKEPRRTISSQWFSLSAPRDAHNLSGPQKGPRTCIGNAELSARQNFEETSASESETDPMSDRNLPSRGSKPVAIWYMQLEHRLKQCHSDINGCKSDYIIPDNVLGNMEYDTFSSNAQLSEKAFSFYGGEVTVDDLCKWILDLCCHTPNPDALPRAKCLVMVLLTFSFAFATAGACAVDLLPSEYREALIDFGRCGRKIRSNFQRFLRRCDKLLADQVLADRPRSTVLPPLDSHEREIFLGFLIESQLEMLQLVLESMSEWSGEFKKTWLPRVLECQVRDDNDVDVPRPSAINHHQSRSSTRPSEAEQFMAVTSSSARLGSNHVSRSMSSETIVGTRPLRFAFCIAKDCALCVLPSRSANERSSAIDAISHVTSEVEVVFHQTTTSISRGYVNTAALKELNLCSWYCGIRNRTGFLYVHPSSELGPSAKDFYGCLIDSPRNADLNLLIVPGRLSEADVKDLVRLTTSTRRLRKLKKKESQNKETNLPPYEAHQDDTCEGGTYRPLEPARRNVPLSETAQNSAMRQKSRTKLVHQSHSSKDTQDSVQYHRRAHRLEQHRLPARHIPQPRSHPGLRRRESRFDDLPDNSLENTIRMVRKTSAWFRRLTGGRKSAPPNERAGSKSRDEWK